MSLLTVRVESARLFGTLHLHLHSRSPKSSLSFRAYRIALPPQHTSPSSQRLSNFNFSFSQGGTHFVHDPHTWTPPITSEEDEDNENDEDRSLDLLVKFVQNVFKKVSKRARKAVRSVLPLPISANLVGFSVNGVLMLASLWILKAFLEVVCTLGSILFISILLIRGIWSGVSFLQESQNQKVDERDVEHPAWNGAQPVT